MPTTVTTLLQAITNRQATAPRSILTFLIGVLTISSAAALGFVIAIGSGESLRWMIPVIVGLLAVLIGGIVIGVFRAAGRDPSGLVLRDVSGPDYVAIQQVLLGDSERGERRGLPADIVEGTVADEQSDAADERAEGTS